MTSASAIASLRRVAARLLDHGDEDAVGCGRSACDLSTLWLDRRMREQVSLSCHQGRPAGSVEHAAAPASAR